MNEALLIIGCILYLLDMGFDIDKNSARALLDSIGEVMNLAMKDENVYERLEEHMNMFLQGDKKRMVS